MTFLKMLGENDFAQGVLTYEDHYRNDFRNTRIVINVTLQSTKKIYAIVDTGAPWCILDPEDAEVIQPGIPVGKEQIYVRGILYNGLLYRIPVTLKAEHGADITVDATFFVPDLKPQEDWFHPNFLGLSGFLERIRFAVDPQQNYFYFGLGSAPAVADA